MEERLNQPVSEDGTRPTEDEVADCVLGKKPGYVKGLGHGPKPTFSCASQTVSSGPDPEVTSLRGIVESQQDVINRMAAEHAEIKKLLEQLLSSRQNP